MNITESAWHKSSYSKAEANCVEAVCVASGNAAIRDTRNRHLGHLTVPVQEWGGFPVRCSY